MDKRRRDGRRRDTAPLFMSATLPAFWLCRTVLHLPCSGPRDSSFRFAKQGLVRATRIRVPRRNPKKRPRNERARDGARHATGHKRCVSHGLLLRRACGTVLAWRGWAMEHKEL